MIPTLEWTDEGVRFLDQTRLPLEESYVLATSYQDVADAITTMVVRGAPAIGVAAAMGMALAANESPARNVEELSRDLKQAGEVLAATRPTAVNLFWAIRRMSDRFEALNTQPGATLDGVRAALTSEALQMYDEDIAACRAMGDFGASLMPEDGGVLTHCNAGALSTCGYG